MLERYKRTFVGTQTLIAAVTIVLLVKLQGWQVAAVFFATMQLGAVLGAIWASQLKRKFERRHDLFAPR
jgi:cyanate permease